MIIASRSLLAPFALLALVLVLGCTSVAPRPSDSLAPTPGAGFQYDDLDAVLAAAVDAQGRVDYAALRASPDALEAVYARFAASSPERHPERFPDRASRLAYWINAYNVAVLVTVVRHYPIASVADVERPWPLFFLPRLSGFFLFQQVELGGRSRSLYALENDVIRERFGEPRIHFAINCASIGCPRLPRQGFSPARLEPQLEAAAREFFSTPRHFEIDPAARTIHLSSILEWFEEDFLAPTASGGPASLLDYVARYAPDRPALARARAAGYRVVFREYDWALNDQASAR